MSDILKQLAGRGLLSERVYGMPEDSQGDHVTADQAKIDPGEKQNLTPDPSASTSKEDAPKDEDEEDPKPKEDEDVEDTIKIDGSRAITALHAGLHSIQILADLVYGAKDELIGKLGDEAGPALHEVLFKVRTAHETLEKIMDKVSKSPEDPPENEGDDKSDDDDKPAQEDDKPAETEVPGAHPPLPKKPESEA